MKTDHKPGDVRIVHLLSEKDQYFVPVNRIICEKEDVNENKRSIVRDAVPYLPPEKIGMLNITQKEQVMLLFSQIVCSENNPSKTDQLRNLCRSTEDVLLGIDYSLTYVDYHFRTSQKRLLTKLLESYPIDDFRSNLFPSRKKGDRNRLLLDYISYTSFSRSSEHKAAVLSLRNGTFRSWESKAKFLLGFYPENALDFLEEKPNKMLRMLAWLIRLGYTKEELEYRLLDKAENLDPQILSIILTEFGKEVQLEKSSDEERKRVLQKKNEHSQVFSIAEKLFRIHLEKHPTPMDGKKVFLNLENYDLEHSTIPRKHKFEEADCILRGLAYKIPKEINRVRLFLSWESKGPVSPRLNVDSFDLNGNRYRHIEKSNSSRIFGSLYNSDSVEFDIRDYPGKVFLNFEIWGGYRRFKLFRSCCFGMIDIERKKYIRNLYEKENCFYYHSLIRKFDSYRYGIVDTINRCFFLIGEKSHHVSFMQIMKRIRKGRYYDSYKTTYSCFSLKSYLDLLFEVHGITITDDSETADMILTMSVPTSEKEISLIDNNFFL